MADAIIRLGYLTTAQFDANPELILENGQHLHLSDGDDEYVDAYVIGDGTTELQDLEWKGVKTNSSQSLAQTLAIGKITGANDVEVSENQKVFGGTGALDFYQNKGAALTSDSAAYVTPYIWAFKPTGTPPLAGIFHDGVVPKYVRIFDCNAVDVVDNVSRGGMDVFNDKVIVRHPALIELRSPSITKDGVEFATINGTDTISVTKGVDNVSFVTYSDIDFSPRIVNGITDVGGGYVSISNNLGSGTISLNGDTGSIIKNGVEVATVNDVNDAIVGMLDDRGNYNPSTNSNLYPTSGGSGISGAILKGDLWSIDGLGSGVEVLIGTKTVSDGDVVRALIDSPGNTDSNWGIAENNFGYVAENLLNKATTMTGNTSSNTKYLSAKAIYDWATGLFQTIITYTSWGTFLHAATNKTTPVDADEVGIRDSVTGIFNRVSLANLWGARSCSNKVLSCAGISFSDSITYYMGEMFTVVPQTSTNVSKFTFANNRIIKEVIITSRCGTAASNESVGIYLREAGTTDYTITTSNTIDAISKSTVISGLNIAVTSGTAYEIKLVMPVFGTNPVSAAYTITLILY